MKFPNIKGIANTVKTHLPPRSSSDSISTRTSAQNPMEVKRSSSSRFRASGGAIEQKMSCPFTDGTIDQKSFPLQDVPLSLDFGTYVVSQNTEKLLIHIGGKEKLVQMVSRFYNKAFQDKHIDKFIAEHHDAHGKRLGLWIAEKMGDVDGPVWSSIRPGNARSGAHRDAWNCPKREPHKIGRRFKLDDCRIWMRLMFWSAREEGLLTGQNKVFGIWFVKFIGHFIQIYERTAIRYAQESADWSNNSEAIEEYLNNGHVMSDILR